MFKAFDGGQYEATFGIAGECHDSPVRRHHTACLGYAGEPSGSTAAGVISYLSGGVGSDQSAEMKGEMHNYPLVLEFAGKTNAGNDYLADIPVQISDAHGTVLVDTNARGPFMLVSLPDGRYTVTARYNGTQQRRVVNVATGVHEHEAFIWPT